MSGNMKTAVHGKLYSWFFHYALGKNKSIIDIITVFFIYLKDLIAPFLFVEASQRIIINGT
jgi:hypothetical protein